MGTERDPNPRKPREPADLPPPILASASEAVVREAINKNIGKMRRFMRSGLLKGVTKSNENTDRSVLNKG